MRKSSRDIEISHWGNIKITEVYDMENRAARFVGEYSVVDLKRDPRGTAKNAFRGAIIKLPYNTWGFSFRDELGNISTSVARRDDKENAAVIELTPRFILLGGWNATW